MKRTSVTNSFSKILLFCVVGFPKICFGQDENTRKPLWRIMGDEISKILPSGRGDLGKDFDSTNGDRWQSPFAGTTHVISFGPGYLATALIETALSPVWITANKITEKSEETTEKTGNKALEEENRKLKEQNAELKRIELELLDKLKNQAEKFIDSYNPNSKVGVVEPELKQYFQESRDNLVALYSKNLVALGAPDDFVKVQIYSVKQRVSDLYLAQYIFGFGNNPI